MKKQFVWSLLIIPLLLTGCGNAKLETENAELKTRLENLERQLQDSNKQIGSQQTQINYLQGELDGAKKTADKSETDLKSASVQIEKQKESVNKLTRDLSDCQKDKEKNEKQLEIYHGKAASAVGELKALRSSLDEQTIKLDSYNQNYLNTKMQVTRLVEGLPESGVKRNIVATLLVFKGIENTWEDANKEIEERTKHAQHDYDTYGQPSNVRALKERVNILREALNANFVSASNRDQKIASYKGDIDKILNNLESLINGESQQKGNDTHS